MICSTIDADPDAITPSKAYKPFFLTLFIITMDPLITFKHISLILKLTKGYQVVLQVRYKSNFLKHSLSLIMQTKPNGSNSIYLRGLVATKEN